jgi:hypothetical protein
MSWYAPGSVAKVRAIKALQQEQFLPLDVIRESMAGDAAAFDDLTAANAIAQVLAKHTGPKSKTRLELLERGVPVKELDWLATAGLAKPGADGRYRGDDLALLATLGAARRAGITEDMLPFSILGDYVVQLRALIEIELRLFREGVVARAQRNEIEKLTTAATDLSERLVVIMRRKLLLPVLKRLIEEESHARDEGTGHEDRRGARRAAGRGVRRQQRQPRRRDR